MKTFSQLFIMKFSNMQKNGKSNTMSTQMPSSEIQPFLTVCHVCLTTICEPVGMCFFFLPEPFEGNLQISWHFSLKNFSLFSYKTI